MIHYIDTKTDYERLLSQLRQTDETAIDLEFDKNHYRYGFNLCLIQLMAGEDCYLIDPLSPEIDISLLFPVLEDAAVPKLCFSFGEDIRLLQLNGCKPKNIVDLSIIASLLNYPTLSLTNLLDEALGVKSSKSTQQSNWFSRPLKPEQKQYAAEDVLHLSALHDKLMSMAEKKEILEWIKQENSVWETGDFTVSDTNDYLKDKDKKGLSETQWHIFSKLMDYREKLAEERNRPTYKVLDKSFLFAIAKQPSHVQSWSNARGMHPGIRNQKTGTIAAEIVDDAVREAREIGLSQTNPAEKPLNKDKLASIRRMRNLIRSLKRDLFTPVKNMIAKDYGEHTAAFIVNNRLIEAYATDQTEDILPYKKDLIEYTASSIGMDVYGSVDEIKSGRPG